MFHKKFTLRMPIKDLLNRQEKMGPQTEHFGVPWQLSAHRNNGMIDVYLNCAKAKNDANPWSITTFFDFRVMTATGRMKRESSTAHSFSSNNGHGFTSFACWKTTVEENTAERTAMIECVVTINGMTGIVPKRQRSFEQPEEHLTDVILKVGEENFHVSKTILAAKSSYFKSMFFGNFDEAKATEVELKEVGADDFHRLLEHIYGQSEITAEIVENLLKLCDKFDVQLVQRRCEQFLLKSVEVGKKEKLRLADAFTLENLMKKCMDSMTTAGELWTYLPDSCETLSQATLMALLEKSLSHSENKHRYSFN